MILAVDRRHESDPHPPDGVEERRRCSDKECMSARTAWYEDTLLPKIQNMFWRGVAATIFACMGGLFFIVKALISQHTLEVEKNYAEKFVTVEMHREDITRLERKVEIIGDTVHSAMDSVSDKLDRNLEEIKSVRRK